MQTVSYKFTKSNRLSQSSDFKKIFTYGKKIRAKFVTIYIHANQNEQARLGVVIAKRSLQLASKRNKIKRVARESFRQHKNLLQGLDIILVFNSSIKTFEPKFVKIYLDEQWKKLTNG